MHQSHTEGKPHRIVNIHQPHEHSTVLGKHKVKVEFGSKLQVSLVVGFTFIEQQNRDAFNEGQCLMESVKGCKKRLRLLRQNDAGRPDMPGPEEPMLEKNRDKVGSQADGDGRLRVQRQSI